MASSDGSIGSDRVAGAAARSLGELELELVRVRSEARAARLEARAAEIELQARQLRGATDPDDGISRSDVSLAENFAADHSPTVPPFASGWEELAAAAKQRQAAPAAVACSGLPVTGPSSDRRPAAGRDASPPGSQRSDPGTRRHDSSHRLPGPLASPPTSQSVTERSEASKGGEEAKPQGRKRGQAAAKGRSVERKGDAEPSPSRRSGKSPTRLLLQGQRHSAGLALPDTAVTPGADDSPVAERRRRPAAWLVSTVTHLVVLFFLAALTLTTPDPRDQLSLSASSVPAASEELESLTIEPIESVDEPSEQVLSEDAVAIDPLGDLAAAPTVRPPAASGPAEATVISDSLSTAEMLLSPENEMTTEFCGVAGGGKHFCYIVDSSQSMKNGRFDSARAELLQSIDQLNGDQRFYVIFYDTNVDRMRVSDPGQPDTYSVNATLESKRALRRWAMQIGLERGAPPDKALEFAFALQPDVIFLLSDGEFPQRIEDLVAELNRDDSLFGDQGPRSILHTIGYHSRDGETRMRRLAEANGGQYHYVPKP